MKKIIVTFALSGIIACADKSSEYVHPPLAAPDASTVLPDGAAKEPDAGEPDVSDGSTSDGGVPDAVVQPDPTVSIDVRPPEAPESLFQVAWTAPDQDGKMWGYGFRISKKLFTDPPECILVKARRVSLLPGSSLPLATSEIEDPNVRRWGQLLEEGVLFTDEENDGSYDILPAIIEESAHIPGGNYAITVAPAPTCDPAAVGAPVIIDPAAVAVNNGYVACEGSACEIRLAASDCGCTLPGTNTSGQFNTWRYTAP